MHVRVGEQRHYQPLAILRCSVWAYSLETVRSVFQVMSIRSPTLTLSNTVGSTTRRLYFHPFGPTKVIDDALLSISAMVAVIRRTIAALPLVWSLTVDFSAVSTAFSPAGFRRTMTLLLYVAFSLSPTLNWSKRMTLLGTLTATNVPSAVLMFMARLFLSIVSMVPEMVSVVVGSSLTCAQLGRARAQITASALS